MQQEVLILNKYSGKDQTEPTGIFCFKEVEKLMIFKRLFFSKHTHFTVI